MNLIRRDEYPLAEVVDVLIRDCTVNGKQITRAAKSDAVTGEAVPVNECAGILKCNARHVESYTARNAR